MKYLQDISYNNIDEGIEYLQKNNLDFFLDKDEITIYHVYWHGNLTRKQLKNMFQMMKQKEHYLKIKNL